MTSIYDFNNMTYDFNNVYDKNPSQYRYLVVYMPYFESLYKQTIFQKQSLLSPIVNEFLS